LTHHRPLLLVIDDLHWADAASLRLLLFLAGALGDERVLLLGTQRPEEVTRDTPTGTLLADVARAGEQIELSGLDHGAIAEVIASISGAAPTAEFVRAIGGRTGGNPFFIGEVMRLLASEGRPRDAGAVTALAVPRSVRDTVLRRLGQLSEHCRRALGIAAVIGNDFRVDTVERVHQADGAHQLAPGVLALFDQAARAGLVAVAKERVDTYTFTHTLIRDSLYEELGRSERATLHRHVAEALASRIDPDADQDLAEVAHHFFQAAATGGSDAAIAFGLKAGARAAARLAYEEAAGQYRRVLHLLTREEADGQRHCEVLLALGEAVQSAGDEAQARDILARAADVARAHALREHLAQAAMLVAGRVPMGTGDPATLALLEEALRGLGEQDTPLRARLASCLASILAPTEAQARRQALGNEAVAVARRAGDQRALAETLVAWHWIAWSPTNLAERLAVATELVALCEAAPLGGTAMRSYGLRIADRLEAGDIRGVDADIATRRRLADHVRDPSLLWFSEFQEALRAFLGGRFDDTESLAERALATGQQVNSASAMQYYGAQLFALRREQGRLAELESTAQALTSTYPANPGWRAALAFLFAEIGRAADARRELEILAANDFGDIPHDHNWLITLAFLSQVAAVIEDRERAALIYDRMLPYADRNVIVAPGIACTGSAAHNLGVLAALLDHADVAAGHFESAIAMNRRLGPGPLAAHSQREYAAMLLRQPTPDCDRARALLDAAASSYTTLGMRTYVDAVAALMDRATTGTSAPTPIVRRGDHLFHRHGDYWTIQYDGVTVNVKYSKGVAYLACLVRTPGCPVHVLDLVAMVDAGPGERQAAASAKRLGRLGEEGLSAGAPPEERSRADPRAMSAYRTRLGELRTELEEAEEFNDHGRATRLRTEIEFLLTELAAAYGVGASRRSTEPTEKARKAVSNRIRAAVRHLQSLHAALGRHLSASLELGTLCRYDPREPTSWDVRA
jgi:hypothetical protein